MKNEVVIKFEWDEQKAISNLKKHKVSFKEAESSFDDPCARLIPDPEHSKCEERFILMGVGQHMRILIVCHCYRENDSLIRIISARKANKKEQSSYKEFLT